jgi:hypothetical protein
VYYIRVLYTGQQNMQYRLRVEGLSPAPAPTPPPIDNSTVIADFGTLLPGTPRAVTGHVSTSRNAVLTQFSVGDDTPVYIKLYELTGDANIELLDSNGNVIASSSRGGRSDEAIRMTLSSGTYSVRVVLGNASDASFRLRLANEYTTSLV